MPQRPFVTLITLVVLQACIPSTWAQDAPPKRKAGLWEMSMEMAMRPGAPMKSQQCVDEASDADMQRRALAGGDRQAECKQSAFKRVAGGYEMQAECSSAEGKTLVLSKASGDMNSRYQVENHIRFDPPRHGLSETRMTIQASHAGACPAGMKAGEVRMAGMPAMPGGRPAGGMPGGVDPSQLKGMSPDELRKWAEEMKKASGK